MKATHTASRHRQDLMLTKTNVTVQHRDTTTQFSYPNLYNNTVATQLDNTYVALYCARFPSNTHLSKYQSMLALPGK